MATQDSVPRPSITLPDKIRIIGVHCEKDTTGAYGCQQWFKREMTVPTKPPVLCDDSDDSNDCTLRVCGKQEITLTGNPPVLKDTPDIGKKGKKAEPCRHEGMDRKHDRFCSSCGMANENLRNGSPSDEVCKNPTCDHVNKSTSIHCTACGHVR